MLSVMSKMDSLSNIPAIISQLKTRDVDELAEFALDWDQDYVQLKRGVFDMEINMIKIGNFQVIEQCVNGSILARGNSPSETFALAIPVLNKGETVCGGNILSEDYCFTGNYTGNLDVRTSEQFNVFGISVPIKQILECAQQMQLSITQKQLLSPRMIVPNPLELKQLSSYIEELLKLAKNYPEKLADIFQNSSIIHLIVEDCLPLLLDVLSSTPDFIPAKKSSRQKLVKRAEELMHDRLPSPISLSELCQGINQSKRTIYRVFQECVGLPPMEYLKILRLHGVRRVLKSSDSRISKVTDIALDWGFWHMGQFSQDYRNMFGESPSNVLRRD